MLLDVCLGTRTSWKILLVLAEAPGKAISRKEIKNFTRLGNKVLSKFLILLELFDIIIKSKMGKSYYYKLNHSNPHVEPIMQLISVEKKQLNNPEFSLMSMLRDFVYSLTNINPDNVVHVVLFGSYAKRTYNKASDIDLAIILRAKRADDELLIAGIIDSIGKRYKKILQAHFFTSIEFEALRKKDNLVQEIVRDGIYLV